MSARSKRIRLAPTPRNALFSSLTNNFTPPYCTSISLLNWPEDILSSSCIEKTDQWDNKYEGP
jgi:hypothetical protein